jgi:hypothetical protein
MGSRKKIIPGLIVISLLFAGCGMNDPPNAAKGKQPEDLVFISEWIDPEQLEAIFSLVINEVQYEDAGSDDEFIELYNPSDLDVDLSLLRIYRASQSGDPGLLCNFSISDHFNGDVLPASTIIPSGSHYLIVNDNAAVILTQIADALVKDSRSSMVITANNRIYLTYDGTPTDSSNIIDMVGYGAAVDYEGSSAAPSIGVTESIQRKNSGQDTDENGTDFEVLVTPTPESAVSAVPVAPMATNVLITGVSAVDYTLTGNYSYSDANGDAESGTTFRWLIASSAGGPYTAISGATSQTYVIQAGDLNRYIRFEVTPRNAVTPTTGTAIQSVEKGPVTSSPPAVDYLVINEVVMEDGAADDEYIEIYNPTGSPIDLGGTNDYRIYRSTSTGTTSLLCDFGTNTHFNGDTLPASTVVPAYGYYLIVNDNAKAAFTSVADALVKDSRMILTANNTVWITTDGPPSQTGGGGTTIDYVGYGTLTSSYYETSAAPGISDGDGLERKGSGQDGDNNSLDFQVGTPSPGS